MKPLSGVFLHGPTRFQCFNEGVLDFFSGWKLALYYLYFLPLVKNVIFNFCNRETSPTTNNIKTIWAVTFSTKRDFYSNTLYQ